MLEKVTWNNCQCLPTDGWELHNRGDNLKEILADNSQFITTATNTNGISDLDGHDGDFLFSRCCRSLERLSIRNAMYFGLPLPQNALIKLVRNAPSLRWFRSSLTPNNIGMLQKERPEVKFLN